MRRFLLPLLAVLILVACSRDKPAPVAEPPLADEPVATPAPGSAEAVRVRDPRFAALPGARADWGMYEGGVYRIEVPDRWNGGLVLYAHGYRGEGAELSVSDPPIRRHLVRNGYAWAASSYRLNGYRPDAGVEDLLALLSVGKYLMGGDLPFWREGFVARMTQAANLLLLADRNRDASPASRAVDTRDVRYRIDPGLGFSAEDLNANARRFEPLPGARTADENAVFAELSGRLSAPVISLHTTGDAFVPFALEQEYRRAANAAGAGNLLVQRAIRRPAHCQFDEGELTRAFDDLVAWIERGQKPEGDDVLTPDLASLGLRWTAPFLPSDPARR